MFLCSFAGRSQIFEEHEEIARTQSEHCKAADCRQVPQGSGRKVVSQNSWGLSFVSCKNIILNTILDSTYAVSIF